MEKTKGKAKVVASNVPSQVEAVSVNDMISESAPSELVEIKEAAIATVLKRSEEVDNREESYDGPDGSDDVDAVLEGEDGVDESDDKDEVEESKDDLDISDHGDKIEETKDALDNSDEGEKKNVAKEDGRVESMATDVPEGENVEERDVTGETKDKGKGENSTGKKAKSMRMRKKKAAASNPTDANKSSGADNQRTLADEKGSKMAGGMGLTKDALDNSDEGEKEKVAKEDGRVGPMATDVPEGEKVEERDVTGETKDKGKGENATDQKAKRMRMRKKAAPSNPNDANKSSGADNRGTLAAEKGLKMAGSIGLTKDVIDNYGEEEKEKVAKKDGRVEPMATDVPEGEKFEERDVTGEAQDNGKGENEHVKKAKRMRMRMRKKKKAAASKATDANKSSDADKQDASAAEKDSMATNVPEGEKLEERDVTGEAQDNGKGENARDKKAKRRRMRKKKAAAGNATDANKSNDADKQGTSAAEKDLKMADGMGLIFMCNAKTKKDCFRYKIFGLPASKKEMVAKVYKGMRLFLFDVDLKLMYGIYKAASSGGYNIEPRAFKSAFPSQVRFTVLRDCLPLPEEKFKAAIKGNYYGRNKFNCQLSPQQVQNLCDIFRSAGKTSKKKSSREVISAEPERTSSSRGWKRRRHERVRRDDSIPRGWKRSRHERVREDDHIPSGRDLYARGEVYAPPPPRSLALPPPQPQVPYAYAQPVDDYYHREPLEYRDPYSMYRGPLSRDVVHKEPFSSEAVYREPIPYHEAVYSASLTPAPYAPPTMYYRY